MFGERGGERERETERERERVRQAVGMFNTIVMTRFLNLPRASIGIAEDSLKLSNSLSPSPPPGRRPSEQHLDEQ